jgi:hypothetical protein
MSEPAPTLTLAGLYARQGLVGKAREMYRLLSQDAAPELRAEAVRQLEALGPAADGAIELLEGLLAQVRRRRR